MYGIQAKIPPVVRPKRPTKDQAVTRTGTSIGLSQGLHQTLQQGLHKGLFQGSQTGNHVAIVAPQIVTPTPIPAREIPEPAAASLLASVDTPSSPTKIRRVDLLSGEAVTHTFCPEDGLVARPPDKGRMLVLTNQRVMSFENRDGTRETVLMPVDEIKTVAVVAGLRSKLMLLQGGLIVIAGVVIYVLLAYWLTGRIDGPTIPVIRMDLVAFLVFLPILSSVGIMSQFYFSKPDGEVTFQGDGVKLAFPFREENAEDGIYQVVNATFAARQSMKVKFGTDIPGPIGG